MKKIKQKKRIERDECNIAWIKRRERDEKKKRENRDG